MNEQQKKNRRTILVIFAMSMIPFCFAWYLSSNVSWTDNLTNNGQLIIPPITTTKNEFVGFDDFSSKHIQEISGHWILVNVLVGNECNTFCQQALHKTKQLRLMLGKDLTRVRRLVLITETISPELAQHWWKEDVRLLRIKPTPSLVKKLKHIMKADIPQGMLFLMDPLGNLMMHYKPDFDPYKVKSDLKKLLRISQIG